MQQYQTGLSLLFWGLILTFFNFNLNEMSILPNFVGFIIIIFAIKKMVPLSQQIQKLLPWTYIMVVLSFFNWFSPLFDYSITSHNSELSGFNIETPELNFFSLIDTLEIVIGLIFTYFLMNFYISLARASVEERWSELYQRRKRFYMWTHGLMAFLIPLAMLMPQLFVLPMLVIMILVFIATIRVLMTSYRIMKLAEEDKMVFEDMTEMEQFDFEKNKGRVLTVILLYLFVWLLVFLV
ncbi:hypothetical protein [Halalkalibacter akibai]|uniref:Uncharacterized protein n=1 Tax=Halalkalibacter akibai (strain ATCC 43226 / DSM 21942 / CIP 109018 / JCM 9157 / 1139) TaxID=1236973 RepID=W4QXF8_HALA3|nr:hypothetical protein [Halalkalibacter akibai]GAE36587.1 hypothetical protein JCM9157_3785 [Halalkalibacter akibai JCM 9157]